MPDRFNSTPPGTETTLLHRVLVASAELANVPPAFAAALMAANSALVTLVWDARLPGLPAVLAGAMTLAACLVNWGLLAALPRAGRSFGPPLPPALALCALLALGGLVLALLWPALPVLALWLTAVTLIAAYATWIAPFRLTVTQETLAVRGLTSPLRLIHIGDLHIERITARERRLNDLLRELKPDVIAFSGDFVNLTYRDDPRAEADVRAVIAQWSAPFGIYAVPGTPIVEPLPRVQAFVRGMPAIHLLLNQWHTAETPAGPLHIAGLITTHDLPTDRAALAETIRRGPSEGARLLIAHSPDIAPEAAEAGFDLILCGHTHGGQIVIPGLGPLFSGSAYGRRFIRGRYTLGRATLYTTRGLGLEGWGAPRARWFCSPEITVWTLTPEGGN
ncbi:MAG: metallophosphoesterase [Anaerolineae bacterium]|nr:metallophosphoesterase [Anaerolineae bacterium]